MNEILDFLTNAKIMELAGDSRVLFGAGVLFVLALFFRWKAVLSLLFGIGGILAVVKYANLGEGEAAIDRSMVTFGVGTLIVSAVLIYFLFIRGD